MRYAWLLALLAPFAAFAQLQVYTVSGTTETPIAGIVELGSTASGDILQVQFRVRNRGAVLNPLTALSIAGSGFRLHQAPPIPFPLPPNFSVDFYVQFQSSDAIADARASLRLNDLTVTLIAEARAAPVVSVLQEDGSLTRRLAGQSTVFAAVERDRASSRTFVIENPHRAAVMVNLAVSGESFRLATILPQPLTLGPGQSQSFEVRFEPAGTGLKRGTLFVEDRTFPLEGVASEPAPPRPSIAIPSGAIESSKQIRIAVTFDEASRAEAKGQLRFEFQPAMQGPDDAAVVFLPVNRRSVEFQVKPGDKAAQFGSQRDVVLQTGTTAGTLRFIAEMSGYRAEAVAVIAPAPAVLDKLTAFKTTATLDMTVTGFDNTRSISEMIFTFYDTNGTLIPPGAIRSSVGPLFQDYFRNTTVGGMFSMRAIFPATASTQSVRYVEMEVTNSAGTSKTQRIEF
ncbi:MAG: choice-of-anchor D domain-containing protein [Bryobacterales bacterium]|nr:choice-of-anchor D domain-containing protein [Bryobacterales bacterium]